MNASEIDRIIAEEMAKPQFEGFSEVEISAGLAKIANAVHKKCVTNSTTKGIKKGLKDPRPFVIQNHGSLENTIQAWNADETGNKG